MIAMQNQPPYLQPEYYPPQPSNPSARRRSTPNPRVSFPWTDPAQTAANAQGQVTAEQITMLKQRPGIMPAGCLAYISFITLLPSFFLYQYNYNPLFLLPFLVPFTLMLLAIIWPFARNALFLNTMGPILTVQGEVVWQQKQNVYVLHTSDRRLKIAHETLNLPPPGPYHFYYLANSDILLSAQPISAHTGMLAYPDLLAGSGLPGHEQARLAIQQALFSSLTFTQDDLNANRMGTLSQAQRTRLSRQISLGAAFNLIGILITAVLGVLALVLWQQIVFGVINLGLSGVFAIGLLVITPRRRAELQQGAVQFKENDVQSRRRRVSGRRNSRYYSYHYHIENLNFRVSSAAYNALVSNIRYRVYYLPYVPTLLSIEPLEDPRHF